MRIEILDNNKHRETIENVTSVTMPCTETGIIEIQTKTQKTLRKVEELNCFQIVPVHTKKESAYLSITRLKDYNPDNERKTYENEPAREFDMLKKIWFDQNYGRQKIYVEGFYDDDGKGKFHVNLGEIIITNRLIRGGNLKLD